MKWFWVILSMFLFNACTNKKQVKAAEEQLSTEEKPAFSKPAIPYQSFIVDCKKQLSTLRKQGNETAVRDFIYSTIAEKMPAYWHGTTWDFNGVTRDAGQGSIACGYFITTILEDIGLKINRIKMAQEPSSVLIKATCSNVKTFATVEQLVNYLTTIPSKTILLTGLDFHTGFIVKEKEKAYFFHSNYIKKQGVVKEPLETSAALNSSKSFMVGVLSNNSNYILR